jgi:hypothetical protein
MKYLIIDAELSGTGIRNYYQGGYIIPEDLDLSVDTRDRLKEWLLKYENEHYNGFKDETLIDELDQEGKEIARVIKCEIADVKIQYFSSARMTKEII